MPANLQWLDPGLQLSTAFGATWEDFLLLLPLETSQFTACPCWLLSFSLSFP